MRTDSVRLSDTALKAGRAFIKSEYGAEYLPAKANVYEKKGSAAQDAHEAIRPIDVSNTPEKVSPFLKPEQAKLYALIWKRFVASQMNPAEFFQRTVTIESGDYQLRATGSSLMFDGFLKVYKVEDEDEKKSVKIPKDITKDAPLDLKKKEGKQHFTKPPARYSQATLVKEMKELDIGRPSTYSATLATLVKRKYVEIENKRFIPSELGRSVNGLLTKNLPDIINVNFTAQMEQALDKVAAGDVKRDELLLKFYKKFSVDVEKFGGADVKKQAEPTNVKCPECKKEMLNIRFGRGGQFLGCNGYPDCTFTSNFERDEDGNIKLVKAEKQKAVETDLDCPKCGKKLVERVGRYGKFIACPGYPECKHIHQETMKMPCPQCGSKVGKRAWRGGEFWGCTSYPKCKFSIFSKVIEKPCTKCKKTKYVLLTEKKDGTKVHTCPEKEACGYKKEIAAQ
jgi:DNA topoisomerase-1